VPLTTEQVSLYEAEVREALHAIATKSGIERQGLVLRLLTVLKQICNHPAQYLHQAGPVRAGPGSWRRSTSSSTSSWALATPCSCSASSSTCAL